MKTFYQYLNSNNKEKENSKKDKSREIALSIGKTLKKERINAGLTQQKLADQIGAKKSFISRIENGHSDIQLSTLYKIIEQGMGKKINIIIE